MSRAALAEGREADVAACRRAVLRLLRELNAAPPTEETRGRAAWIAAKCRKCRMCDLAPD